MTWKPDWLRKRGWLAGVWVLACGGAVARPPGQHIRQVVEIAGHSIRQYEKFEVGLALDRAFATGERHANPYDPDDVSVEARFVSPSGRAYPVRYGFYYRQFAIRNQYLQANDARYWNDSLPTPQPWRVRFSPDEVGTWRYTLKVVYWDSVGEELPARTFACVAAPNSGYLKVAPNHRNLMFDSGQSFFAIGSNADYWGQQPIRVPAGVPQPLPHSANLAYCGGTGAPLLQAPPSQQYQFTTHTFSAYDQLFRELHDSGGNFVRLWMQDSNWDIETYDSLTHVNTLGYYEANQARMYDFDRVLRSAWRYGIYMQLSLLDGARLWDVGNMRKWRTFPYHTSPALALATPEDFFLDARARQLFKNKLRYVVARWGYSPRVAAYELINEGDFINLGNAFLNPFKGPFWKLSQWTEEMACYLKELDPRHLQTLAYGPENIGLLMRDNPDLFDYTTSHFYGSSLHAEAQRSYLTQVQTQQWNKPFQIQESDYLPYLDVAYQSKFHSPHWATAFSGAFGIALPLSAFANLHHPCWPAYAYYQPLARFLAATSFSSAAENRPIGNSAAAAALLYGPDYAARLAADRPDSLRERGLLTKVPATADPAWFSPCDRLCPLGWPNSSGLAGGNYEAFDRPECLVGGVSVRDRATGEDRNALIEVFALQNAQQITGWVHNKTHYWYNLPHGHKAFCDTSGRADCLPACATCADNPALPGSLPLTSPLNTITPFRGLQLTIAGLRCPGTYRIRWFYTQPGTDVDRNGVLNDGGFIRALEQAAVLAVDGQLVVDVPPLVALGADGPTSGPDYAFVITSNAGCAADPR